MRSPGIQMGWQREIFKDQYKLVAIFGLEQSQIDGLLRAMRACKIRKLYDCLP
jgi:hypothetical protein